MLAIKEFDMDSLFQVHQFDITHMNQIPIETAHTDTHAHFRLSLPHFLFPRTSEAEGLFQGSVGSSCGDLCIASPHSCGDAYLNYIQIILLLMYNNLHDNT